MAYSLSQIFIRFRDEVQELNQIVLRLSTHPPSLERDTHIEGCYIRLVVLWEVFCEEYFLRCLCTGRTRSQYDIKPKIASIRNINEAFKRVNVNRRDRDKDYIDWLDSTLVKHRIDDYFRANSRVQKLVEAPDKLFEMRVIRNAIAHKSTAATYKFQKFVKDQLGYLSSLNPSTSDLLVMRKRASGKLIFLLLSEYFVGLAERLTK